MSIEFAFEPDCVDSKAAITHVLIYLNGESFAALIGSGSLMTHADNAVALYPDVQIVYVVEGMERYFLKLKESKASSYRQNMRGLVYMCIDCREWIWGKWYGVDYERCF